VVVGRGFEHLNSPPARGGSGKGVNRGVGKVMVVVDKNKQRIRAGKRESASKNIIRCKNESSTAMVGKPLKTRKNTVGYAGGPECQHEIRKACLHRERGAGCKEG